MGWSFFERGWEKRTKIAHNSGDASLSGCHAPREPCQVVVTALWFCEHQRRRHHRCNNNLAWGGAEEGQGELWGALLEQYLNMNCSHRGRFYLGIFEGQMLWSVWPILDSCARRSSRLGRLIGIDEWFNMCGVTQYRKYFGDTMLKRWVWVQNKHRELGGPLDIQYKIAKLTLFLVFEPKRSLIAAFTFAQLIYFQKIKFH